MLLRGLLRAALLSVPLLGFPPTGFAEKRPYTFLDIVAFRRVSALDISPDGKSALFETLIPDWKKGKSFADIFYVSIEGGAKTVRQMTYTAEADDKRPRWSRDASFFVFISNRQPPVTESQLYMMRPDGGEAIRLTAHKGGVQTFEFSRNGAWLAYSAGPSENRQLYLLKVSEIEKTNPIQLTRHAAPVDSWLWAPDSSRIYFTAAVSPNIPERDRIAKGFTAKLRNPEAPPSMLWTVDLDTKSVRQLTHDADRTVSDLSVSRDGNFLGFRQIPNARFRRSVAESDTYGDLFLLSTQTGSVERITDNREASESRILFSPDSKMLAFAAPEDFQYFRRRRLYVRPVSGGPPRKLGNSFDADLDAGFWSPDSRTVYANAGIGATHQVLAVSVATGEVEQLTRFPGVVSVSHDGDSGRLYASYEDPNSPLDYFAIPSFAHISQRTAWRQLTDSNPYVRDLSLGATETVRWKSTDGREVEGVLVLPVNYTKGQRYPLIVQIHGGPASATLLDFGATYSDYSQVYAGAGYACLLPNYRGSTNYGERFRTQIAGNYFQQGYDDIMTGVDHLITQGIADPNQLGVMGWSAGGHWSNWILTHSTRFKAISSGAGAVNWISMYAQTDVQRIREQYFGGLPYDRFEEYWNVSPLKYIRNAKTPTLIHVVDGDPRVPRPQSEELHMALRQLGVPTEFLVYPGTTHGITDMRNRVLKMVAEFRWMEKWVRGRGDWLPWNQLLSMLPEDKEQRHIPGPSPSTGEKP